MKKIFSIILIIIGIYLALYVKGNLQDLFNDYYTLEYKITKSLDGIK